MPAVTNPKEPPNQKALLCTPSPTFVFILSNALMLGFNSTLAKLCLLLYMLSLKLIYLVHTKKNCAK